MATIPSLPSRDEVLRRARRTTDITAQLLDTAGNITRYAINTPDPRDGSGAEAQPAGAARAGRVARATAVRVSAAVSPAGEGAVLVAVAL